MNLPKLLYKITSPILKVPAWVIFLMLLISIVPSFEFIPFSILTFVLGHLSSVIIFCWIYAIGYAANENAGSKGIVIEEFRYFSWMFVIMAVSALILQQFQVKQSASHGYFTFTLSHAEPFIVALPLGLLLLAAYLYAIHLAAKALLSAEISKIPRIGHVGSTSVLMWIPIIGVWFIQPRIQRLLKEV